MNAKPAPLFGAAVAALLLASCAARHSALEYNYLTADSPAKYRRGAEGKPLSTTVPRIFDTGPEIKREMLRLIESATDYILIDSFLVVNDEVTSPVMEALKKKHDSGVRVCVLADSSSRYMNTGEPGFDFFRRAGVPTAEFNPMRAYKMIVAPVMLPRDHRKFWIVDGKELFLGGANIFPTSLKAPAQGGNRDIMVTVRSAEAIERMIESFVWTWNQASKRKLRKQDFPVRVDGAGDTRLWLFDQNKDAERRDVISKMFGGLFAAASQEIWLVQPYTFVTDGLVTQIENLTARGVEVNLMLSGEFHAPRFKYASYYGILSILDAGGKVWICRPGNSALHTKAVVVDRRWATVGSANLNSRSFHLSKEVNLVFDDPVSVGRIMRTLDELKRSCRPVKRAEAQRYRGPDYYAAWLWMQVAG